METEPDRPVSISDLIDHSRAMLAHAEAGEWQTVVDDERVRRQLFDIFFATPSTLADEAELRRHLEELLQINGRLQRLAAETRDRVLAEANTISDGRKAVNAYAEHSR